MPSISTFFGIAIYMYWDDHAPPHLHAFYLDKEAMIAIQSGDLLAGELPKRAHRIVREWIIEHQAERLSNWERGQLLEPFEKVAGADVE